MVDDILKRAQDNVQYYYSNTSKYQDVANDDIEFVGGNQWKDQNRGDRPQTVVNDAPSYIRKVKDFYKRRQSSIKVTPIDNVEDPKTARVLQGIVDQIMRDSLGDFAMDKAFDDVLKCGQGFCYVDSEYESDESFNQCLRVEYNKNPLYVFFDLDYKRLDKLDMEYAGWLYNVDRDQYKDEFGDDADDTGFTMPNHNMDNRSNTITLCRYYERTYVKDTLVAFIDPSTNQLVQTLVSDLDEKFNHLYSYLDIDSIYDYLKDGRIISKRTIERPQLKWYILNGTKVLKQGDWAGKYIPIIPMLGEEYKQGGEVFYTSLIRWSKESGRLYNYYVSNMAETLAMAPITPAMAMPQQVEGFEHIWASANKRPVPYLPFNPIKLPNGQLHVQPPMRPPTADIPSGWITAAQTADADKKNTLGIQEVAMGMDGQENSGKAILARSDQSLDNVSCFIDSRKFATHYLGMVLVDLIPKYYDTKRIVRIIGNDRETEVFTINDQNQKDFIDIKNVKYDIYIDEGPSYASQRKESQASFLELAKVLPQPFVPAIADKMVEYMDIKDAKETADRIRKLMPQEVFVDQGEKTPEQIQAELEQQVQQLTQQTEAQTAQIEEMKDLLYAEKQKLESNERIALAKADADLNKEQLKFNNDMKKEIYKSNVDIQKEQLKQGSATQREIMSNQTDIKTTEMDNKTDIQIQMMKMMKTLDAKIESVIAVMPHDKGTKQCKIDRP